MQSRFFSEFGRMDRLENIGASPGKNPRSEIHDKTPICILQVYDIRCL
jgi:hypothetical protein